MLGQIIPGAMLPRNPLGNVALLYFVLTTDNIPGVQDLFSRNDQRLSLVRARPEAGALTQNSTQPSFLLQRTSARSW